MEIDVFVGTLVGEAPEFVVSIAVLECCLGGDVLYIAGVNEGTGATLVYVGIWVLDGRSVLSMYLVGVKITVSIGSIFFVSTGIVDDIAIMEGAVGCDSFAAGPQAVNKLKIPMNNINLLFIFSSNFFCYFFSY